MLFDKWIVLIDNTLRVEAKFSFRRKRMTIRILTKYYSSYEVSQSM